MSSRTYFLRRSVKQPRQGGRVPLPAIVLPGFRNRVAFQWKVPRRGLLQRDVPLSGRGDMHREDLMNPDLLSEIVLLGCGSLLFVSLWLIVATALTRA